MSKITYTDKEYIYENASIPAINKITDDDMNEIKTVVNENDDRLTTVETGWVSSNETWTYSSVDDPTGVITISGDKTTKYSLGMRIKFTNGGNTIYGIITKISYSSPNTTLTFLHEINPTNSLALHLMANSAITLNYYSNMKAPFGFPASKNKWSIIIQDTNELSQSSPSANTYYNLGSLGITVPIGLWNMSYEFAMEQNRATANYLTMFSALSTSNNSVSDNAWRLLKQISPLTNITQQMFKQRYMEFTSKTQYYLIIMTDQSSTTNIKIRGSLQTTTLKAECAYL